MKKEMVKVVIYLTTIYTIMVLLGICLVYNYNTSHELNTRIKDNVDLSKPWIAVFNVESKHLFSMDVGWYSVCVLAIHENYTDPQYIYDFRYDDNTDTLYYDDNIKGVGVKNPGDLI